MGRLYRPGQSERAQAGRCALIRRAVPRVAGYGSTNWSGTRRCNHGKPEFVFFERGGGAPKNRPKRSALPRPRRLRQRPDDSVTDATENAARTHHRIKLGGQVFSYTAKAGHLVAVDASSSKPCAKIFYVAFTVDGQNPENRPVTFFYNGGPGSSSVFVLLGSFAPRRIDRKSTRLNSSH